MDGQHRAGAAADLTWPCRVDSQARHGRRAAVLLSADDYDTLQDTIAVLSDPTLLAAHSEGQAALEADDYVDADQLAHAMGEAGRLPQ